MASRDRGGRDSLVTAGVIAALLALVLLATSTALLWRTASEVSDLETAERRNTEPPPPLPRSRGQGSTRVLLRELESTTDRLTEPLNRIQRELGYASGSLAPLGAILPDLAALAGAADALGATAQQLRGIERLASIEGLLQQLAGDVSGFRRIVPALRRLRAQLTGLRRTLRKTNRTLERAAEAIEEPAASPPRR
jgi:hypothetical protein